MTCTSLSVHCYCRRTVEEAHAEMVRGAGSARAKPMCATCGQRPAQDTQCPPCRDDRQRRAEQEFAAWWAQLRRGRGRGRGAGTEPGPSHLPSGVLPSS
ncbi:hypothetical protein [Frankia umida]|uniref:hypothetical protein n=1 Tax=Frankia umida TaxID=573489 RepID=UPI00200C1F90|nr:hypothetical protein [Frankia umida]